MKEKTAEEAVRRYWREFRLIQLLRWILLALYIWFLWEFATGEMGDSRWWFLIHLASLAVLWLCLRGVRLINSIHYMGLERILNEDCDPVKYAEVCRLLGKRMKKSTGMIRLNEAKGLCQAGRFREAAALMDEVELDRRSGLAGAILYQNVAFNCALRLGEDLRAGELRRQTARLLEKKKPGRRLRAAGGASAVHNGQRTGVSAGDYETLRRIEAGLEGQYTVPLQHMAASVRLAQADLAEGKRKRPKGGCGQWLRRAARCGWRKKPAACCAKWLNK